LSYLCSSFSSFSALDTWHIRAYEHPQSPHTSPHTLASYPHSARYVRHTLSLSHLCDILSLSLTSGRSIRATYYLYVRPCSVCFGLVPVPYIIGCCLDSCGCAPRLACCARRLVCGDSVLCG
jgi:hypothetical protein